MSVPENPLAFPLQDGPVIWPGMTLRDWFAGHALAGQLASVDRADAETMKTNGDEWTYRMFAKHSYALADALLAHREKGSQP